MEQRNSEKPMLDDNTTERAIADLKLEIGKDRMAMRILQDELATSPLEIDLRRVARDIINLGEDIALKQLKIKRLEQLNDYRQTEEHGEGSL